MAALLNYLVVLFNFMKKKDFANYKDLLQEAIYKINEIIYLTYLQKRYISINFNKDIRNHHYYIFYLIILFMYCRMR